MKGMLFFLILAMGCSSIEEIGVLVPPTVDQDKNLPSIKINVAGRDRLIHLRQYGDSQNPVLFVIHGSYSDSRAYKNIFEGLSDRYFVVTWDQRGCGLSERIREDEFSLDYAIDEVVQLKNIFSPQSKISVLGHSWGGGVATLYTARHPEDVEQLVLIEPIPLTGNDMQALFSTIIEFSYADQTWNNLARQGEMIAPVNHEQIDYRAMMILKSTMTRSYHCDGDNPPEWPIHRVGGFVEWIRGKKLGNPKQGFTYDFTENILQYNSEVLILGGSCSSLGYSVQNNFSKRHFSNARVVEIENAGHRMNIEKYDTVMTTLKSFLHEY